MTGPQPGDFAVVSLSGCPTPCDADCDADCHEGHDVPSHRSHDPGFQCGEAQRLVMLATAAERRRIRELADKHMAWCIPNENVPGARGYFFSNLLGDESPQAASPAGSSYSGKARHE